MRLVVSTALVVATIGRSVASTGLTSALEAPQAGYNTNSDCDKILASTTLTPQANGKSSDSSGSGSGQSGFSTQGSDYENKYGNYFGGYYDGKDGPGSYDNNNDNANGAHKTQVIMCLCTKHSTDANTGMMDQNAYSQCVNDAYGNNKDSWDNSWQKYTNQYNGANGASVGSDASDASGATVNGVNAGMVMDGNGDAASADEPGIGDTTATLDTLDDAGNQDNSESIGIKPLPHANNVQESSLNEEESENENGNESNVSITHSEYMEYLAVFLIFVGVISLIAIGVHCIKYTYKAYRLRNYEQIGASSKQNGKQNSKGKKQDNRIRLPRKQRNVNQFDNGPVYTIGQV